MREILFRGMRADNGEWAESNSIMKYEVVNKRGDIVDKVVLWVKNEGYVEVIPETVVEYTGLTDQNGKRIFEGDILSDGDDTYRVRFESGVFWIESPHYSTDLCTAVHMDKINEVIGNTHDNPELLEVEE